jgi:tRNA nucleotidyltransferase (CCA-adding enzyme)
MQEKIDKVCRNVLKTVNPTKEDRSKIENLARKLEKKVAAAARKARIKAKIRVEGSVAKDTWLSGEPDIDIFMRVPSSTPRKSLGDICLCVARKATEGSKQVERFAEHPYLEAFVEDTRINVVPCYDAKQGEWQSATDRTPFHTDYMKKHLGPKMRCQVRLLKKFMKGIGVYGAEIKTGGFSGYLCELLILQYGSFVKTLEAFARHRQRMVVDIEEHYRNGDSEIALLFSEPMVIVDPVDRGRNVASAVQAQRLHTFVAAAQAFLRTPDTSFFCPPETVLLSLKEAKQKLKARGSAVVFVVFDSLKAVPDVLWGQLYKSQRSLCKLVQLNDFRLLRDTAWSDEKTVNMFIFEVEQQTISPVKKHLGPPLDKEIECRRFLGKHGGNADTVCGPYVEDDRWVVILKRKYSDAAKLLNSRLKDGGRNAGVAEQISHTISKGYKILVNEGVLGVYEKNLEFAVFLTEFLDGRPKWLMTREH